MNLRLLAVFTACSSLLATAVQAGQLVSGPMLGYRSHREVFLWLETKGANAVTLDYWIAGKPETAQSITRDALSESPANGQVIHFRPGMLEVGADYEYTLSIDGEKLSFPYPTTFKTTKLWEWRGPPPEFTFLVGSCLYVNEPAVDRPGTPYGKGLEAVSLAGETGADFMVWLGDNWYYREVDYSSVSGLWHRAQRDRAQPELQKLLGTMNHYATWDDHDYGPNDSNWSFEFKEETRKIFKSYWGNPSYGERGNPGVYTKFYWGDAVFILMDDYTYRDDVELDQDKHEAKSMWGRRQLEWLKQSLLQAKSLGHYTFKFIGNGTQVLQTGELKMSHEAYRREREELIQFIADNKITGVVFLTGDVHHTGLYRRQLGADGPWIYEITSSPLSAGSWAVEKSPKADDPFVIKETLVGDQNFVSVSVTGEGATRALVVSSTDKQGVKRFEHTIKATDLGFVPRRRSAR
ncbi:MAG: alkaline phosphatase D family protein [Candidatus Didemnitutus sp.]|nr:alkaline phosphatase D family protein [Candidatus Didemnitutus sp.]